LKINPKHEGMKKMSTDTIGIQVYLKDDSLLLYILYEIEMFKKT